MWFVSVCPIFSPNCFDITVKTSLFGEDLFTFNARKQMKTYIPKPGSSLDELGYISIDDDLTLEAFHEALW